MADKDLQRLAEVIDDGRVLSGKRAAEAAAAITERVAPAKRAGITPSAFLDTDEMILIVDHALPGWSITIDGVASERDGHWVCVLRNSGGRDNDAFVGIGKCPRLPHAILSALLKALAFVKPD
ncbi:MAG: hypothetical protein KJO78_15735 [Alphaproteobacteria bacterium]|nr:hypothetical protein [Alphaproteobacteria bacterium]